MNPDYLHRLLDAYFDGGLTEAGRSELEAELLSSRESRVLFWQRAKMEEALRTHGGESRGMARATIPASPAIPSRPSNIIPFLKKWGFAAAAAVIFVAFGWWQGWRMGQLSTPEAMKAIADPQFPSSTLVAVVASSFQANWGVNSPFGAKSSLPKGPVYLESGLAGIRLLGGTRIFMEGPARFTAVSESAVEIQSGYYQVEVPTVAREFSVKLHGASIASPGGTFYVIAGKDETEVRCPEGSITLSGLRGVKGGTQVAQGQIATFDSSGKLTIKPDPAVTNLRDLKSRISRATRDAYAEWRAASARRAQDPDLLVYFNMDSERERTEGMLLNQSSNPAADREAPIISAQWVDGRWPGKHALSFRETADRVRVGVRGNYPKTTFVVWMGIDELKNRFNGIFYSDWDQVGEVHWQINAQSAILFNVHPPQLKNNQFLRWNSPDFALRSRFHEWKQLVTTYDSDKREAVHYVNGREIARKTLDEALPVQFGNATLGNRPSGMDAFGPRPLGGAIDEFMVYSRVLDANEVAALYEEGKPDR